MSIKQAFLSDLSIVKKITEVTIAEIYPRYYPKGAVDFFLAHHSEKNIRQDIKKDLVFLYFDISEKPVGTVTIRNNEICRLFVLPSYQGKGYGKAALSELLKLLRNEYHRKKIYLSVVEGNNTAIHLYEKFGFSFTGERDIHGEKVMMHHF